MFIYCPFIVVAALHMTSESKRYKKKQDKVKELIIEGMNNKF